MGSILLFRQKLESTNSFFLVGKWLHILHWEVSKKFDTEKYVYGVLAIPYSTFRFNFQPTHPFISFNSFLSSTSNPLGLLSVGDCLLCISGSAPAKNTTRRVPTIGFLSICLFVCLSIQRDKYKTFKISHIF